MWVRRDEWEDEWTGKKAMRARRAASSRCFGYFRRIIIATEVSLLYAFATWQHQLMKLCVYYYIYLFVVRSIVCYIPAIAALMLLWWLLLRLGGRRAFNTPYTNVCVCACTSEDASFSSELWCRCSRPHKRSQTIPGTQYKTMTHSSLPTADLMLCQAMRSSKFINTLAISTSVRQNSRFLSDDSFFYHCST